MNREILEKSFDNIKQRKGAGGKTYDYIEASAVIQRLNDAFDAEWSFRVIEHIAGDTEIAVLGELTAEGVTKQQFGGKQILKNSTLPDNLKSATSDAIKKCASLFGVGLFLHDEAIGNGNGNGDQQTKTDRITDEQSTQMSDLAEKLGWTLAKLQENIQTRFSKSLHELTKLEAGQVIAGLQAAVKKANDGVVPQAEGVGEQSEQEVC